MEQMLFDDTVLMTKEDNLLRRFEEINDFIYSNDGLSPQQALEEFVKVLFIKIYDENGNGNQFSSGKINDLFEETKHTYPDVFDADDRFKISDASIGFIISKLQGVSLLSSSHDAKGLAFQKFLSHHEKDRQGQFFTPEPIIDFCVRMLQPGPDANVIDPACGSGGFLMSALKYVEQNYKVDIQGYVSDKIFGCDINKSILRIAKMKLLLDTGVNANLVCANSLESLENLNGTFDLILTNPPFGAKITNSEILAKYDMGHKWLRHEDVYHKSATVHVGQITEILFIERCLQLLKDGGRMAIVLPNGDFENPSLEYLRYYIKLKSRLLAVVKLPQETFIPFGTGVKTSILFIEKDTQNIDREYQVFFGKVTRLGYQGNKNGTPLYRKDRYGNNMLDGNGQPVIDEDFSEVVKQYREFLKGNNAAAANSFSISYNELNGRFDYDFYAPENRALFTNLKHGKTIKFSEICDIVKSKSPKLKNNEQTVEYVELSDINTHSFEIINSTTYRVHELPSRASYEIREGDIITAIAGNSVGTRKHATAFVSKEFDGSICTNGFRVLRNFRLDPYYLLYYLRSEAFLKQMFMYRTGAAIPNVSDTDLANIQIYIPNNGAIDEISARIREAFELRQKSREQIEQIELEMR